MFAQRRLLLVLFSFLFLVAARNRAVQHPAGWPLTAVPVDKFSFAQPSQVTTKHIVLDLTVDFATRSLRGSAELEIENLTGTNMLVLDTSDLHVTRVTLDRTDAPATWSLGTVTANGTPLNIGINAATRFVKIEYSTASNPAGLYWSTAEQTYGRQQPYVYSLNEPTGARGWIPTQDTPTVRSTYEATLRVPRGLLALMSAADNPTQANDTGIYVFHMPSKIPSYLIALGVGRLAFHEFDERTGVYAEPELLEDAAWELAYLPEMVDKTEAMLGPFPFERHDLLLMPPTFIVGGMEHPMLNFIAPFNLITGNKPAVLQPSSLIAHELAHTWAGDSTTLANWNDVWLNEGITSYLTHRILEMMSGPERAEYGWYSDLQNYSGYVRTAPAASQIIHRDVPSAGTGFGSTGYVKGALFIKTLEDNIGRATFDAFLRRYFQIFAFRWVDHHNFLALLRELALRGDAALEARLRLNEWLYEPGLPSNVTAPPTSAIWTRVTARIDRFTAGTPMSQLGANSWSTLERDLFIASVPADALRPRMAEVDAVLGLSFLKTPPLQWLVQTVEAKYQPSMPAVERALMRGAPSGWITSLYNAYIRAGMRDQARTLFASLRKRYREDIERQVATILGVSTSSNAKRDAA
jgi:aminopeptidase N